SKECCFIVGFLSFVVVWRNQILRKKQEEGLEDWKNGDKKSIRGKAKEWKSVPRSNHQPVALVASLNP
ncbi:hypothetical protein Godav_014816, partial [Gossypium davidsonii]|nr:hypothetical protein [Gossypium davidsonii]